MIVDTSLKSQPPLIVIAAGGAGNRMGGNKPERLLGGVRLIDRALLWARQHSDALALSARPGDSDLGTGLPLLFDTTPGIGPISSLHSAITEGARQGRSCVLLIGCDLPFLPRDLVARLSAALPGHGVAMPVSGGRLQPMAALWRCETEPIERWIANGGQSLWRFGKAIGIAEVEWDETPDPFANVNDTAALAAAEERVKKAGR